MTPHPQPRERDKNGHLKAGIRLPGWDYCKPWIYMITLVVKRRQPILGQIVDGKFHPSPLGEAVAHAWRNMGRVFPEVEPCQFAVMPEHFHGIVWVHQPLKSPLGEVIRSFKIACTKANIALGEREAKPNSALGEREAKPNSALGERAAKPNSALGERAARPDGSPTFWFPGLYDTILFGKGQLRAMTRYVLRNVERRWAVMQNRELFKVTRSIDLAGLLPGARVSPGARVLPGAPCAPIAAQGAAGKTPTDLIGNHFLIDRPNKLLVQVSRRATPAEIEAKINEALLFGERGGVIVSGCISPGEQAVARAVREAGLPLIAIVPRGFGPYFKPSGAYFDACAAGRLLMLSPFPQIGKTEPLTRQRCFGINAVAAAICGNDPDAIHYRGSQPGQLAP